MRFLRSPRATSLVVAAVIVFTAVLRLRTLGDVVGHVDEQFYLLVGDRMLAEGAIPYADIWDRKPVGLFLIYAAIRLLGGDGIVEYQLVATLAAGATACMLALWVMRAAGAVAALLAAAYYLLILQARVGFGGQAEVFVNLFIVGAAAIVHAQLCRSHVDKPVPGRSLLWQGAAAMLLVGAALQIKPTAVFPGGWMGIVLLWCAYRRRMPLAAGLGGAALWIGCALLPTLCVTAWYAGSGLLDPYLYANFGSIFSKGSVGEASELSRHAEALRRFGIPFAGAAVVLSVGIARGWLPGARLPSLLFLLGWLAASAVAYAAVGAGFAHYILIAAPVGCLLVGYAAGVRRLGWIVVAAVGLHCVRLLINEQRRVEAVATLGPQFHAMADAIQPELSGGCLYVYRGPVILYMLTGSCLPTRFPFPTHLSSEAEARALPVDADQEVRRILAARPPVIVHSDHSFTPANEPADALVEGAIARDYEPFASLRDHQGRAFTTAYRLKR